MSLVPGEDSPSVAVAGSCGHRHDGDSATASASSQGCKGGNLAASGPSCSEPMAMVMAVGPTAARQPRKPAAAGF